MTQRSQRKLITPRLAEKHASPEQFSRKIILWQKESGRHDLPWQKNQTPYTIWLSEIMLQQTQVSTVIPYYLRFIEQFPTLEILAKTPLDSVFALWAGLGYYARARNLHRCAQTIMQNFGGQFPQRPEELVKLPGIGPSTANAIAAFAFHEKAPILDGNVQRVFSRQFGIEESLQNTVTIKDLWQLAAYLLPEQNTDMPAYTQGLMDLGATLCTRHTPKCSICPVQHDCIAYRDGTQSQLPRPKIKPVVIEKILPLLVITDSHSIYLEERPLNGIWGGLWSLPVIENGMRLPKLSAQTPETGVLDPTHPAITEITAIDPSSLEKSARLAAEQAGYRIRHLMELPAEKHTLTHRKLIMPVFLMQIDARPITQDATPFHWQPIHHYTEAPLPTPVRRILARPSIQSLQVPPINA